MPPSSVQSRREQQETQLQVSQEESDQFFSSQPSQNIHHHLNNQQLIKKIIISCFLILTLLLCFQYYFYDENQLLLRNAQTKQIQQIKKTTQLLMKQSPSSPLMELNPKKMETILEEMMKRPIRKMHNKPNHIFKPTQHAYFAYSLYQQPDNINYLNAEYYYYETKYNISKYSQLPLCIVAPGRNLQEQGRYIRFLQSIAHQNYSNYKLIYIDDQSTDETVATIRKFLSRPSFENLSRQTKIIVNTQRLYALANRNSGIRNYCDEDDIIIDIDPDDIILGQQAFKFINSVYQNPQTWIFYTNYVLWSSKYDEPSEGISGKIPFQVLSKNQYRVSDLWLTSATRTFRRKVYMKIDDEDFKDQKGKFYKWTSDLYMHYSLVELSGPKHYKYLHEIFYYYYPTHNRFKASEKVVDKWNSYTLTPYKPLKDLEDEGRKVENYKVPQWIIRKKKKVEEQIINSKVEENVNKEQAIDKKYFQSQIHGGP